MSDQEQDRPRQTPQGRAEEEAEGQVAPEGQPSQTPQGRTDEEADEGDAL